MRVGVISDTHGLLRPEAVAALALAYEADTLARYSNVLVVVCGGATATLEQIHTWLQQAD